MRKIKSANPLLAKHNLTAKAGMYIYSLIVDGRGIDTKRMILTDK